MMEETPERITYSKIKYVKISADRVLKKDEIVFVWQGGDPEELTLRRRLTPKVLAQMDMNPHNQETEVQYKEFNRLVKKWHQEGRLYEKQAVI